MPTQKMILSIVKVNRGIIDVGKPTQGQHIPYFAGLVVANCKAKIMEFLDIYNSEILLREYFGYKSRPDASPSLSQIVQENREYLSEKLTVVEVEDLDEYIKSNKLVVLPRNAANMRMMAQRMVQPSV